VDQFVAFLDVLGTTEMVNRGEFSDWRSLDFANPVGLAARIFPHMRFAVFSDSVVVSCPEDKPEDLLKSLSFLYGQWYSDYVLVRGGVTFGEIWWVDHPPSDELFRPLHNFMYARVYGRGLISAHQLEQRSGPGALCFADDLASHRLASANALYILEGQTDALVLADRKGVDYWAQVFSLWRSHDSTKDEERRHLRATEEHFKRLQASAKALPDDHRLYE